MNESATERPKTNQPTNEMNEQTHQQRTNDWLTPVESSCCAECVERLHSPLCCVICLFCFASSLLLVVVVVFFFLVSIYIFYSCSFSVVINWNCACDRQCKSLLTSVNLSLPIYIINLSTVEKQIEGRTITICAPMRYHEYATNNF